MQPCWRGESLTIGSPANSYNPFVLPRTVDGALLAAPTHTDFAAMDSELLDFVWRRSLYWFERKDPQL
jgi:hypothetical protein